MHTQRTECPHCHHQFNISDEQLALKNGLARCGKCHQNFDANEHLLLNILLGKDTPKSASSAPSTSPASVESPKNSLESFVERFKEIPSAENQLSTAVSSPTINAVPHSVTKNPPLASEMLWDDNTPLHPNPTPTSRSLNQKKQFNPNDEIIFDDKIDDNVNDHVNEKRDLAVADGKHTPTTTEAFSLDILEDFEKLPTPHTSANAFKDTTNPPPSPPNEEAWLEQLLNEEKEKELNASHFDPNKISAMPTAVTDVASLLDEFEVEIAPDKQLSEQEYYQKVEQRLTHQPTPQKIAKKERHSALPTLLWSLGSGLLLLGLVAQYIAYNRDDIVKKPSEASTLRAFCSSLNLTCNLANADSNAIAVQVTDLEAKADKTDATLTLTNQSNVIQLYPALKLTFMLKNAPVSQLIALPSQYLDTTSRHMSAEQIKPIKLRLDIARTKFDKIMIEKLY